jgi:hypothetical protein
LAPATTTIVQEMHTLLCYKESNAWLSQWLSSGVEKCYICI